MPTGKVMTKNSGWVNKPKEKMDYSKFNPLKWLIIISFIRWYPDRFLQLCESKNADIDVAFLQSIYLRLVARNQETFITGGRGTTKTHVAAGSQITDGTSVPGMLSKHFAPTKEQAAELVGHAFKVYEKNYPILMQEWLTGGNGKDTAKIVAPRPYFSSIESNATLASNRGGNLTRNIAEEYGQEDDKSRPFDHKVYRSAIAPSIRKVRKINQITDEYVVPNKTLYITSATSQQNDAFLTRQKIIDKMKAPKKKTMPNREGTAIAVGNSWIAVVASGINTISWAKNLIENLLPEEILREMGSIWTGTSDNPMVTDLALTRSRTVQNTEFKHCEQPNVHYILGIDSSYSMEDGNAKCAVSVVKCSEQKNERHKDKLLREVVNLVEFEPPVDDRDQARFYKKMFFDYLPKTDFANAGQTLIGIDAYTIGNTVIALMMGDLQDGLPPLCCTNGYKDELASVDAISCIVPIRATKAGTDELKSKHINTLEMTVSDTLMIRLISQEFIKGNLRLLTSDIKEGVNSYKRFHSIKNDDFDSEIAVPYIEGKDLVAQIRNLKLVNNREQRIKSRTQRDKWSATKYANFVAYILEQMLFYDSEPYVEMVQEDYLQELNITPRAIGYTGRMGL